MRSQIISAPSPEQRSRWRRRAPLIGALLLGVSLSAALALQTYNWQESRQRATQHRIYRDRAHAINDSISASLEVLSSIRGLYDSSREVFRDEFRAFVEGALMRHPEILALGWVPRVRSWQREKFVQEARADGFAEFQIMDCTAPGDAAPTPDADCFPVYFIEPLTGNQELAGNDLQSESRCARAMERSAQSGNATATAPVTLMHRPSGGKGLMVFLPVYEKGIALDSIEQRGRALQGFVMAIFVLENLVDEALKRVDQLKVAVILTHKTADGTEEIIVQRGADFAIELSRLWQAPARIADQEFKVHCQVADGAEGKMETALPWIAGVIGLIFTALSSFLVHGQSTREISIERRVQARTAQLRLQYEASRALEEAATIDEALDAVLQSAVENLGLDLAVVYSTLPGGDALACKRFWSRPGIVAASFETATLAQHFKKGQGLPGQVWASGEAQWISDVTAAPDFVRAAAARQDGLHTAIAFPVLMHKQVEMVIEMYSQATLDSKEDLLYALSGIGSQLGLYVDRRRAEQEQRVSDDRYRDLFEHASDLIQSTAPDGRLLFVNRVWLETLGYRQEEVQNLSILDIIHPESMAHCQDMLRRVFAGEQLDRVEARFKSKSGNSIWVEGTINCKFEDGLPVSTRAIFRDVTERRRAQMKLEIALAQAESANRAKTEFLASMSHELRTPLNSVIGFANVLLKNKSGALSETEIIFLNRILENGKHLMLLINQVLDLSKIEAGRAELEITEIDLAALVRSTVEQLQGGLKEENISMIVDAPPGPLPLATDSKKLRQVLINLIGNAVKFTDQGTVTVRIVTDETSGAPTAIEVEDTGIGIAADRLGQIFDAFKQVDSSTSRSYDGTGLGLTISKSLAELMGYQIEVSSKLGVGSTFRVVLRR